LSGCRKRPFSFPELCAGLWKSSQFPHNPSIGSLHIQNILQVFAEKSPAEAVTPPMDERNRTMKNVLLTFLVAVILLGLFAAVGFSGYRFGYAQGVEATSNGETLGPRLFERMGPGRMPMHEFGMGRGFPRGFGMDSFSMMGFIVWFGYWLFTRSGYSITRTAKGTATPPTETAAKE
jgi:hypothetical protein